MKTLLIAFALLLLSACAKEPESTKQVGISFQVDKLFTHENCTLYRFTDMGYPRYYAKCEKEATVSWEVCRSVSQEKSTRTECTPHSTVVTHETKKDPS